MLTEATGDAELVLNWPKLFKEIKIASSKRQRGFALKQILVREWYRFYGRCRFSAAGLILSWREEHSFRFWVYMDLVSSGLALWLPIDIALRAMILCLGILVLAAECLNTAIERVVDYQSTELNPLAKAAKDAGSAGVALTALSTGVAWVFAVIGLV